MEIRDDNDCRVVTVEREALAEVLVLAQATGWEVLAVVPLPGDRVEIRMTR